MEYARIEPVTQRFLAFRRLEGELAAAREKLALLEDEKRSLQIAVDQALARPPG
jgi:hypothetical protein